MLHVDVTIQIHPYLTDPTCLKQIAKTKVRGGIRLVIEEANVADVKTKQCTFKFWASGPLNMTNSFDELGNRSDKLKEE